MKKIIILAVVSLFIFGAFTLNVDAKELKLGFVDLNRALNESDEGKKAVTLLESLTKIKKKLIGEKENEINKLKAEIQGQSAILNSSAMKKKQEQLEDLLKVTQRMVQDSEEELKKKSANFQNNIIDKISNIIAKLGKDEGYTAIFELQASGLIYRQESTDLTDKIIELFNGSE